MLDIRFIRENPELLQRIADQKGIDISIEDLLRLDETRRSLIAKVEQLRNRRNGLSQEISSLLQKRLHEDAEKMKATIRTPEPALHGVFLLPHFKCILMHRMCPIGLGG